MSNRPRSPLLLIFVAIFIDVFCFGLILPSLPFYAETYGATPFVIGALSTSYSFMQFVFAPLWGRISDRVGRRPILIAGLAGSAAAYALFGIGGQLGVLFAGRALGGIVSGAVFPAAQAYIADITPPEERARGMGLFGAAFGLGFIFGPALGGWLSGYGHGIPAMLAAAVCVLNTLWVFRFLPESLHPSSRTITPSYLSPARLKETFGRPHLAALLIIYFLAVFSLSNMESTFALYNEHHVGLGAAAVGTLLAEVGIMAVIVQGFLVGRLSKRFGESRLATIGIFISAVALGLTTQVQTYVGMAIIVPFFAIGSGLAYPSIIAMISRSVGAEQQGATLSIGQGMAAFGRVLGPLWGTWLFGYYAPTTPYWVGSGIMLLVGVAAAVYLRRRIV